MGEMGKLLPTLAAVLIAVTITGSSFAASVSSEGVPPQSASSATTDGVLAPATEDSGVKPAALIAPVAPALQPKASAAPTPALTPGRLLFSQTHDASITDPINWSVLIHKSRHELILYFRGRLYDTYPAVFGRNLDGGAKEYANDRRTPEGVYTIIKKFPSRRYEWFLKLNYPNQVDRIRYEESRVRRLGIGGSIGIHGTDVPVLNEGLVNWTTGCVSVSNTAIEELARRVPIGTLVIIRP